MGTGSGLTLKQPKCSEWGHGKKHKSPREKPHESVKTGYDYLENIQGRGKKTKCFVFPRGRNQSDEERKDVSWGNCGGMVDTEIEIRAALTPRKGRPKKNRLKAAGL